MSLNKPIQDILEVIKTDRQELMRLSTILNFDNNLTSILQLSRGLQFAFIWAGKKQRTSPAASYLKYLLNFIISIFALRASG